MTNEEKEKVEETAEAEKTAAVEETVEESAEAVETAEETEPTAEEKLAALQTELDESENKYLKLHAEVENFKRRSRQEAELNNKYKDQKIAENLLPVLDNLERALAIDGTDESFIALNKGVEMVYKNLVETLEQHDIKTIDALNQPFDPNFHQAVMTEAADTDSDIVIEEFQKGYILKDRVIRPAMVKVSE